MIVLYAINYCVFFWLLLNPSLYCKMLITFTTRSDKREIKLNTEKKISLHIVHIFLLFFFCSLLFPGPCLYILVYVHIALRFACFASSLEKMHITMVCVLVSNIYFAFFHLTLNQSHLSFLQGWCYALSKRSSHQW